MRARGRSCCRTGKLIPTPPHCGWRASTRPRSHGRSPRRRVSPWCVSRASRPIAIPTIGPRSRWSGDSVSDLLQDLGAGVSTLGGNWTKYSVVGSFVLYVFGYLAVRFHLTAIGIGTDLGVLDEHYLFTGARFLVYLVSAVPILLLVLMPVVAVLWGLARLGPSFALAVRSLPGRRPAAVAWFGVAVAVVMIQFVMRQCFLLNNLLLARNLPADPP